MMSSVGSKTVDRSFPTNLSIRIPLVSPNTLYPSRFPEICEVVIQLPDLNVGAVMFGQKLDKSGLAGKTEVVIVSLNDVCYS